MKKFTLNDGTQIPQLGLGTWKMVGKTQIYKSLDAAFQNGYDFIDTAQYYNNEKEIGSYLKEKGIDTNSIYLTTKVWPSNFFDKDVFKKSIYQSLKRLQVKKVNLILLHWAISEKDSVNAYKWLEEVKEEGLTKSIGVSNFNIKRLKAVLNVAKYKPVVNQVRFDPKNQQLDLTKFCKENNIWMQGYSILRSYLEDKLSSNEKTIINNIASKYNKTWGQIILKWSLSKDFIIFPKSINPQRIKQNIDLFDFDLEKNEINEINKMNDPFLLQRMDSVANGDNDNFTRSPLLYENHFKLNSENKIVEDLSESYYK